MYKIVQSDNIVHLEHELKNHVGWKLIGPVMPVQKHDGTILYLATLENKRYELKRT